MVSGLQISNDVGIWLVFNLAISLVPFGMKYFISGLSPSGSANLDEILGIAKGELLILCIAINADVLGAGISSEQATYTDYGAFILLILIGSCMFGALSVYGSITTTSPPQVQKRLRVWTIGIIVISLLLSLNGKIKFSKKIAEVKQTSLITQTISQS
jgi:hypothetical protein